MQLADKNHIRQLLLRDPRWCVYALGDLTPRMFEKCQWFASSPDLALVLHDYGTSILFAMGTGSIKEALAHVRWPAHLQVRQDGLDEVARAQTSRPGPQMAQIRHSSSAWQQAIS